MSTSFLLLALDSPFSRPVLQALLEAGHLPSALILPHPDRNAGPLILPLFSPITDTLTPITPSLPQIASQHLIPIIMVGDLRHPETLEIIQSFQPDLLLTACFPRLFPKSILDIPRMGSLNLHPSMLPAYRGPEPLFWQFYFGETRTGVTLHFMDEKADTGDIVSQTEVQFPDGILHAQAETLTAQAGGVLICQALSNPDRFPRTPQPKRGASSQTFPTLNDLIIPTSWYARRAYNFIKGARDWGPFEIEEKGSGRIRVRDAVVYVPRLDNAALPLPGEDQRWIQFSDGEVLVSLD